MSACLSPIRMLTHTHTCVLLLRTFQHSRRGVYGFTFALIAGLNQLQELLCTTSVRSTLPSWQRTTVDGLICAYALQAAILYVQYPDESLSGCMQIGLCQSPRGVKGVAPHCDARYCPRPTRMTSHLAVVRPHAHTPHATRRTPLVITDCSYACTLWPTSETTHTLDIDERRGTFCISARRVAQQT